MNLSILDIFLLTQLDRGVETPYDLQRQIGISLGGSLPSLRRLIKRELITMSKGFAPTKRPRHQYSLTVTGKRAAQTAWKPFLEASKSVADMDSILRITDMAAHYRAEPQKIHAFLQRAKAARNLLAEQIGLTVKATRRTDRRSYGAWRTRYDHSRLLAEAELLSEIATSFNSKREGQLNLPDLD